MQKMMTWLKQHFLDILFVLVLLSAAIIVSPTVIRQFKTLNDALDICWNVGLDMFIVTMALVVFYFITKLLKRFDNWITK